MIKNLNKNQIILLIANVLLVFFLILLSNLHVLPLRFGDFVFFFILILAFALFRPGWSFLFFVGTIMLEQVNLAPLELGIAIRPYQFFGAITILALIIRAVTKKLNFKLIRLAWFDLLVILLGIASFASIIGSPIKDVSFKQSVILASFIFLYFLARNYIQTTEDLKKIIPFFLASSGVVMLYGIWQNIRFMHALSNFEAMPGRPNATFTEADWYGISLVLSLAVLYSLTTYFRNQNNKRASIALAIFVVIDYVSLILTVSRSAWLGAFAVTFVYLFILLTNLSWRAGNWRWQSFFEKFLGIIGAAAISLGIVYVFHLTNFQLFNRAQSAGSGLQKITVSCQDEQKLPKSIKTIDELEKFGCRHINLEEIEGEQLAGNIVSEIYRKDPNINIRGEIYKKSWEQIIAHPVLGIGWGSVSIHLGTDERGVGLNASNIFLEVWLGTGIIGLLAFLGVWIFILLRSIRNFFFAKDAEKILPLSVLLGWFALTIPNLFNSGIMLGFLWLFLASAVINDKNE